jgi:hypothetical protein
MWDVMQFRLPEFVVTISSFQIPYRSRHAWLSSPRRSCQLTWPRLETDDASPCSVVSCLFHYFYKSRDSSVGIALDYRLDDRCSRVRFPAGAGNFSFPHRVQPPIQWVPGALSLGLKRPGREADHSPPSSAKVKEWVELYRHSPNTPLWRGA